MRQPTTTRARPAIWSLVNALFAPIGVPGYESLDYQVLKLRVDRTCQESLPEAPVIYLSLASINKAIDAFCPLFPETRPDLEMLGKTGPSGVRDLGQLLGPISDARPDLEIAGKTGHLGILDVGQHQYDLSVLRKVRVNCPPE